MNEDIQDQLEIERLKNEIQQEVQMKEMLEQSMAELRQTVGELEKRHDSVENESNEWKTRFETQEELNQQQRKQTISLQDKIEQTRKNIKHEVVTKESAAQRTPKDAKVKVDDLEDQRRLDKTMRVVATSMTVKNMEREKGSLDSQLKDLHWRIDQESKAYHKAHDERKQYLTEINAARHQIEDYKQRHKVALRHGMSQEAIHETPRFRNIPPDQRVLDPRKGPIRKTAAVKTLPSLDQQQ